MVPYNPTENMHSGSSISDAILSLASTIYHLILVNRSISFIPMNMPRKINIYCIFIKEIFPLSFQQRAFFSTETFSSTTVHRMMTQNNQPRLFFSILIRLFQVFNQPIVLSFSKDRITSVSKVNFRI